MSGQVGPHGAEELIEPRTRAGLIGEIQLVQHRTTRVGHNPAPLPGVRHKEAGHLSPHDDLKWKVDDPVRLQSLEIDTPVHPQHVDRYVRFVKRFEHAGIALVHEVCGRSLRGLSERFEQAGQIHEYGGAGFSEPSPVEELPVLLSQETELLYCFSARGKSSVDAAQAPPERLAPPHEGEPLPVDQPFAVVGQRRPGKETHGILREVAVQCQAVLGIRKEFRHYEFTAGRRAPDRVECHVMKPERAGGQSVISFPDVRIV